MAAGCYFSLGDKVTDNIVLAMSNGWERVVVEIMLLLHLVTAYPIITNPPAQFFEQMLNIPSGKDLIIFSPKCILLIRRIQLEEMCLPLPLRGVSSFHC